MKYDILTDLAVEKIRMDFGDFIASLFRLISIKKNCFFNQLIFICSNVPYKTLRTGIILLFQHNLILFENFQSLRNLFDEKLRFTIITAVISEAIYRIRYPHLFR